MVDQQEALERQRELYQEKNEHLERFLEPVAPYEFYREIFPEGGDFLFKAPEGPLFGSPFSPCGFAECMKRGVRNGGSARGFGTAERALSGKE